MWSRFQYRLAFGPRWFAAAVMGAAFGLIMLVLNVALGNHVLVVIPGAVVGGLFFGLLMGGMVRRANRRALAGSAPPGEGWTPETWSQVTLAVRGRDVPSDPAVRAAAHRMLVHQADRAEGWRPASVALFVLIGLAYLWLAISSSSWWWLIALPLFWGMAVWAVIQPRRLRGRAVRLAPDASAPS